MAGPSPANWPKSSALYSRWARSKRGGTPHEDPLQINGATEIAVATEVAQGRGAVKEPEVGMDMGADVATCSEAAMGSVTESRPGMDPPKASRSNLPNPAIFVFRPCKRS